MMKNLGIYGSGGLGKELFDLAFSVNAIKEFWNEIYFIDDNKAVIKKTEVPVYTLEELEEKNIDHEFVIAVGEPLVRKKIREKLHNKGYDLAILCANNADISSSSILHKGVVVFPNCFIGPNTIVEKNTIIHSNTVMSHDSIVGNDCMICPNVSISGNVDIGDEVFIGIGSSLKHSISVQKFSVIGMGSTVITNLDEGSIVMSNPARKIGVNNDRKVL